MPGEDESVEARVSSWLLEASEANSRESRGGRRVAGDSTICWPNAGGRGISLL